MNEQLREEHIKLVSSGIRWRGKRVNVPKHEAEDVAHDAYVTYLSRGLSTEEELYVCLYEACTTFHRKNRLQGMHDPLGPDLLADSPENLREGVLFQLIKSRPTRWHRKALALYFLHHYPLRDIVELMEKEYGAVDRVLERFKHLLQEEVDGRDSI